MTKKERYQIGLMLIVSCLFVLLPCTGYGVDLTIGNSLSTHGDWTVNGAVTAGSFSGDGSGLTNVTATKWKVKNIAVVAKSGGDYADPLAAMANLSAWCSNPCVYPNNDRCLLKIMPGTYDIGSTSLQMQKCVDIEGAGKNDTIITGSVDSNTFGLVRAPQGIDDPGEIRHLTVENRGNYTSTNAIAISNDASWFVIKDVSATAWGATNDHYGIYMTGNANTTIENVSAFAGSGNNGYAIYSNAALVTMTKVDAYANPSTRGYGLYFTTPNNWIPSAEINHTTVTARGGFNGSTYSYGIYNQNYVITMKDVKVTASEGTVYNYGVFNTQANLAFSNLTLIDVVTDVTIGNQGFGVFNTNTGGNITVDHSVIKAITNTVRNDNSSATFGVGATKLFGGGVASGTMACVGVYNGNYGPLSSSCQ